MHFGAPWLTFRCGSLLLFVVLMALGKPSDAQPLREASAPPPEQAEPTPRRDPGFQNVRPDVYLWDRDGDLVLVPDFSFEEFERLYQQDLKMQGPAPPPFVLQEARVQGTADGVVAQVEVRCQILLMRSADRSVKVPLRLNPAILQDIHYEGPGEAIVAYDSELEGYVCWLRGSEQTQHAITLKMAVRLRQIGDDTRFELQLPETRTRIDLTTALENLEVRSADEQYVVDPPSPKDGGGSRIIAEGLGGDLRLDWRAAQRSATPARPLLNATASVTLTCEAPTYLLGEAQLEVRAERGILSTFHVQLPPGMKLIPREVVGYSIQVVQPGELQKEPSRAATAETATAETATAEAATAEAATAEADTGRMENEEGPFSIRDRPSGTGQIVRVDVIGTRERTASFPLYCEYSRPSEQANEPFETVGFTVLEAFQQRTELVVAVEGEWSLQIVEATNVRRVGNLTDVQRERGAVSRHVYFQSPAQVNSLRIALQPQTSLIHVDPTYLLRIREQQVRLDAVLRFRVRGAAVRKLTMTFPEWNLLDVQPADILAAPPEMTRSEAGEPQLLLPVDLGSRPRGEEFEIRISAEQPQSSGDQRLVLALPVPRSSQQPADQTVIVSPATVLVSSADSLELSPVSGQMPELYSVARSTTARLPEELRSALGNRSPLMFQSAAAAASLRVVADIRRRPQVITAMSQATLRAESDQVQIEQDMTLIIEHKSLQGFQFELATPAVVPSDLTVLFGDEVIPVTLLDNKGGSERSRFEILLPSERIGELRLRFRYAWPLVLAEESTSGTIRIPLVTLSKDLPIIRAKTVALLVPSDDYQSSIDGDEWLVTDEVESEGSTTRGLQANRLAPEIRLRVNAIRESRFATTIRKIWVQSLFSDEGRFDRAVFHLSSTADRCEVQLPVDSSLRMEEVFVALNGEETEYSPTGRAALEVPLPVVDSVRDHVLEVWYAFTPRYPGRGSMNISVARLLGDTRWARSYWQLVTPRDEHLLWTSTSLADESIWRWRRIGYGRQALLNQAELEQWIGAVPSEAPPRGMNSYLFSSFGDLPPIAARTVSRGFLVLVASGGILAVGLSWIYVPVLRHPAFLLVYAVVVGAVGFLQPGMGVLLVQAASAGLVLSVVAVVLDRTLVRHPQLMPFRSTVGTGADSVRSQGYTSTTTGAPMVGPLSTTTIPYSLELPGGEPKPSAG